MIENPGCYIRFISQASRSKQAIRRSPHAVRGLSLLEVILALSILAVATAYLANAMELATTNALKAQKLNDAELVAESVMNQVIAGVLPADMVSWTPYYNSVGPTDWMYQLQQVPTEIEGMVGYQVAVQRVDPQVGMIQTQLDLYANRWIVDPALGLDVPPEDDGYGEEGYGGEGYGGSGSSSSSGGSAGMGGAGYAGGFAPGGPADSQIGGGRGGGRDAGGGRAGAGGGRPGAGAGGRPGGGGGRQAGGGRPGGGFGPGGPRAAGGGRAGGPGGGRAGAAGGGRTGGAGGGRTGGAGGGRTGGAGGGRTGGAGGGRAGGAGRGGGR